MHIDDSDDILVMYPNIKINNVTDSIESHLLCD